jgi:hypothetical protein
MQKVRWSTTIFTLPPAAIDIEQLRTALLEMQ